MFYQIWLKRLFEDNTLHSKLGTSKKYILNFKTHNIRKKLKKEVVSYRK